MVNIQVSERSVSSIASNKQAKFLVVQNSRYVHNHRRNSWTNRKWEVSPWRTRKRRTGMKKWISSIRQPWDRYITAIVYLSALAVLSFMIFDETETYRLKPTATAVEDNMYPVQKITFPAIAICSWNVLSARKVASYAKELSQMEKFRRVKNVTVEKLQDLLKYMGHMYTFSNWETNPGDIKLLESIFVQLFGDNYDIERIMTRILTSCRSNLKHCSWGGEIRACEELFIPRWSHEGLCCTFNYVRWSDTINSDGKNDYSFYMERTKYTGYEHGLRVFLNPDIEDNYYNILPAPGFKVMIFTATDYPDSPSGGVKEIMIGPGREKFIQVKGTAFYSSPDVIHFDKSKRKCLFSSEQYEEYGGTYSYTQCIMLCRSRDITKTCGCVPFFYPYPEDLQNAKDCTLVEVDCLKANRYKWWSIKPLETELKWDDNETSLDCDCLPSCETVDFSFFVSGSPIRHYDINSVDFVQNYSPDNVTKDSILLTISFQTPAITRLRQDVMFYWYDLMSAYGGLCSMFLGFSLLKPVEFIYELYMRKWSKRNETKSSSDREGVPGNVNLPKFSETPIYWTEIIK